jgi:TatD DNase family protein
VILEKDHGEEFDRFIDEINVARNLRLSFTDTHAHFHFDEFKDKDHFLKNCETLNVAKMITVGIDKSDSLKAKALSDKYENVFYTLGFHPHDAAKFTDELIVEFASFVNDRKMVAIGEIGLDFFRNFAPVDLQVKVFEKMLEFARLYKKPIVVHNRDASVRVSEVIDGILEADEKIGIIHCFNGDKKFLKWALNKGFYISYAGTVTFKKEDDLRNTLSYVPMDRIFIETDCPYLTPSPKRGKMNEPAYVAFTGYTVSRIKKVSVIQMMEQLEKNFISLFGVLQNA